MYVSLLWGCFAVLALFPRQHSNNTSPFSCRIALMDHPWCRPLMIILPQCIPLSHHCCHHRKWPRSIWHEAKSIQTHFPAAKPPKQLHHVPSPAQMLCSQFSYFRTPLTQVMSELHHCIAHVQHLPVLCVFIEKRLIDSVGGVQRHVVKRKNQLWQPIVLATLPPRL